MYWKFTLHIKCLSFWRANKKPRKTWHFILSEFKKVSHCVLNFDISFRLKSAIDVRKLSQFLSSEYGEVSVKVTRHPPLENSTILNISLIDIDSFDWAIRFLYSSSPRIEHLICHSILPIYYLFEKTSLIFSFVCRSFVVFDCRCRSNQMSHVYPSCRA